MNHRVVAIFVVVSASARASPDSVILEPEDVGTVTSTPYGTIPRCTRSKEGFESKDLEIYCFVVQKSCEIELIRVKREPGLRGGG